MSCGVAEPAQHQSSAVFAALAVEEETCRHQERTAQGRAQHSQPVGAGLGKGFSVLHRRVQSVPGVTSCTGASGAAGVPGFTSGVVGVSSSGST